MKREFERAYPVHIEKSAPKHIRGAATPSVTGVIKSH
jgi:hypothetical protein